MEMFRFENTEFLWLLILVLFASIGVVIAWNQKNKRIEKLGNQEVIKTLVSSFSSKRWKLKALLGIIILFFICIGLAEPQFGEKQQTVKREGVELIVALDVSNSMLAEDIKPSRLERAKMAISKLIDNLHSDKLGLIVFAGDAYTQLPITTDYSSARMFLNTINPDIIPKQGTAIGSAITLAGKSFETEKGNTKALIIITDGENNEGSDALLAAKMVKEQGIIVHTIGMGLEQGAPIPIKDKFGNSDFKKDEKGEIVISKLNEAMLNQIALAGGGIYLRANNVNSGLGSLFEEITRMDKVQLESTIFTAYQERFQYVFSIVLVLLMLDFILPNRVTPKETRFNKLFKAGKRNIES